MNFLLNIFIMLLSTTLCPSEENNNNIQHSNAQNNLSCCIMNPTFYTCLGCPSKPLPENIILVQGYQGFTSRESDDNYYYYDTTTNTRLGKFQNHEKYWKGFPCDFFLCCCCCIQSKLPHDVGVRSRDINFRREEYYFISSGKKIEDKVPRCSQACYADCCIK